MGVVLSPFAWLLNFLYSVTNNYGLAVIAFCLIFKILMFPISIKGRKGMLDMSRLTEKQKELQKKYGKDRARYQEELQQLYANEGVNPSGGCLWQILPMPFLFALYAIVSRPFTYLAGLAEDQLYDLSALILGEGATSRTAEMAMAQDVYLNFDTVTAQLPDVANKILESGGPINFDFFGLNLSETPNIFFFKDGFTATGLILFLIPIISAALSFTSTKVNMHINRNVLGQQSQNDATMKQMMFMGPIISLWICFTLPATLGIYWIANSLFMILQEFCSVGILKKHLKTSREEAEKRTIENKEAQKEKKAIQTELKKKREEEARRIKMERKISTNGISESRVGLRAYAKGRTYDSARYEVTPYKDPDQIILDNKDMALKKEVESGKRKKQSWRPQVDKNAMDEAVARVPDKKKKEEILDDVTATPEVVTETAAEEVVTPEVMAEETNAPELSTETAEDVDVETKE